MIPLASNQMICDGRQHLSLTIIFHIAIAIRRIHPCPLWLYSNRTSSRKWKTRAYGTRMGSGKSCRIRLPRIASHSFIRIIAPIRIGDRYSRVVRKLCNICNAKHPDLRNKESKCIIYIGLIRVIPIFF